MLIRKMLETGDCQWCNKTKKDVVEVELDSKAVVRLCWPDFKKTVKMRSLTAPQEPKKS